MVDIIYLPLFLSIACTRAYVESILLLMIWIPITMKCDALDDTVDTRKTVLPYYTVWYDGTIECQTIDQLCGMILDSSKKISICLPKELLQNEEVKKFNRFYSDHFFNIVEKKSNEYSNNFCQFAIPREYSEIDMYKYTEQNILPNIVHDSLYEKRCFRLFAELEWFLASELRQNIFRTLLYIIDVLKNNNVFWGVGRGSSCAAYIFYLIDLHLVDSVLYDIPMEEFFK